MLKMARHCNLSVTISTVLKAYDGTTCNLNSLYCRIHGLCRVVYSSCKVISRTAFTEHLYFAMLQKWFFVQRIHVLISFYNFYLNYSYGIIRDKTRRDPHHCPQFPSNFFLDRNTDFMFSCFIRDVLISPYRNLSAVC